MNTFKLSDAKIRGERLPGRSDSDLVHHCPRKAGLIAVNADGTCPYGCHKSVDRDDMPVSLGKVSL